jgi:ATP-dependent helicase HrpB
MVGGRGVRLSPASSVLEGELFVCVEVDAGESETIVHVASGVERAWLPAESISTRVDVEFDVAAERVIARRRVCYDDLVLEESSAALPDDERPAEVLAAAAAERLERVLPGDDSPAGRLLGRVRFLREWMPELELPAFDEAHLRTLLPWLCRGRRSLGEVRSADWLSLVRGGLSHAQWQALEREAPEHIALPSGRLVALRYEPGRPPVLAARIQELFGLHETPRLAGGRVRVLLHLLAPNYRPQQVTDDLASFWNSTYHQVRKELRARYPKHAWPEDPWSAEATGHRRSK